jgi:Cu/Ag efflux protein CusF
MFLAAGLVSALAVLNPAIPFAQRPVSTREVVSDTFTIAAIDQDARVVTLADKDGVSMGVYCGPEVQRFDELKVGQQVTFRYYESLVTAISQPGTAKPGDTAAVTGTSGTLPGGTIARQMTARVAIEAIDPNIPSVTISTASGNKMSFKVDDKKKIEGYKPGDQVDITYTQALAVSVESAK